MKLLTTSMVSLTLTLWTAVAAADPWNERTILKFDQAVMVPGVTLAPGTYVFQLGDATTARHTVRITRENDSQVIATVQAVPMRRTQATNDIALQFDPTERGAAPALKGWYYPGRLYGHEFIYPEDQARQIAERTQTLVLSGDPAVMSDMSGKGTLHVLDAKGMRSAWKIDEGLNREWDSWNRARHESAAAESAQSTTSPGATETTGSDSHATLVQAGAQGMRVKLDDLEQDPNRYIGKQVTVDGEVDSVIGPRLFKIDEPGWADLDGELIVALPAGSGALLKENDRVTVSGTVRQFVRSEVERDWGWLDNSPELELKLARKPVIVADRVIGADDQRTVIIRSGARETPVGTAGAASASSNAAGVGVAAQSLVSDAVALAAGDDDLVGHRVDLDNVKVSGVETGHGFFIGPRDRQLFVLTQYLDEAGRRALQAGQNVSVEGFVMQMPGAALPTLHAPGALNRHIYVYATGVR